MALIPNPYRGVGLPQSDGFAEGGIADDPDIPTALFAKCPVAAPTPLREVPDLAERTGCGRLFLKDERARMGLGSFKALGAAYAIAKEADRVVSVKPDTAYENALAGRTYVCASAGNHGLSMAAGARLFGAEGVVYLSETVPKAFAGRLEAKGAQVVRAGTNYEESMAAARQAAEDMGWMLLSDSSWMGYTEPARDVMEGYLIMGAEIHDDMVEPPSHVFLQAGVGGLAAAMTAAVRRYWGDAPKVAVVEPEAAPALIDSILAARPVKAPGPVSSMGRLDCKEPSHLALRYLSREADAFMTVSEADAADAVSALADAGYRTSPSGGAGFAGLMTRPADDDILNATEDSRVLVILSEGPSDD